MPLAEHWTCDPYDAAAARALAAELGLSSATASILVRRGYATPDSASRFLAADDRHDPFLFSGMRAACGRILDHVSRGSRIAIHGDYDVDGVCSTAILARALRALGADPRLHLPSRDDGYGLSRATVEHFASDGIGLLITVDCGITAVDEVALAQRLGVEMVVTDHHRPAESLPDCPIVHPAFGYPCGHLCGSAVAHKLAEALHSSAGVDPARANEDLDLVALATIADVVPLLGENRRVVREGLVALARARKPGLQALARISGCAGRVDEHAVGFRLAPRLNAAGRLGSPNAALELVLCEDDARAAEIADELDLLNRERQDTETRILFAAEAARSEHPDSAAYVLAGEDWHPGVIGIVAGRLVERYHRPCVVIALDGDSGRGSGRSIRAYDLHAGLAASSEHLRRFGGHRAAAGLELDAANVDAFRAAFCADAAAKLSPADLLAVERVDAVVSTLDVGLPLAEELDRLRPFGHGNPRPSLLVPAAEIADVRSMGEDAQHARCRLVGGGAHARAVAFRTPANALQRRSERSNCVVSLELNEWRGAIEPRLVLRALCPTEPGPVEVVGEEPFWDVFRAELEAEFVEAATPEPTRSVCDRRGAGFAAVVADAVSSGESVLVVCADTARRRGGVEAVVAGTRPHGFEGSPIGIAAWDALRSNGALARRYTHIVALDPPLSARALADLAGAGEGLLHLAWSAADAEFTRSVAAHSLDLRAELTLLYRELRTARDCSGETLERILRGSDRRPRAARVAARLVRILSELGLAAFEDAEEPRCRVLEAARTELERSPTYRHHRARLEEALPYLDGCLPRAA